MDIPGMGGGVELLADLRPYVRQCGAQKRGVWHIDTRCLLDYLLVYIQEGRGKFEIDNVCYDVNPGDLFCIPPATPHKMEGYAPFMICPFVHFDLVYRPVESHWDFSIPGGMTDLSDFTPLMHPPVNEKLSRLLRGRIDSYTNRRVGDIIREICVESARSQPYSQWVMSGLMLEALAEIFRGREGLSGISNMYIPALNTAAAYIRNHCAEKINMKELAGICSVAPSYFRRLFGQYFGCSPRDYQRRARIQSAKELMFVSDMNITEIALEVGYVTVHSFSRAFRAEEGISPSQYRRAGEMA
jgi:AraC-like DNA-binding protein